MKPDLSQVRLTAPYRSETLRSLIQDGRIRPLTLISLLLARSLLLFLGQGITALVFWSLGDPDPWTASVPYWNVFGALADAGCLLILHFSLKKEGFGILDLLRTPDQPLWRDILLGIGLFLLLFPTAIFGITALANLAFFGALQPDFGTGLLIARQLPGWAKFYSIFIWWWIWSPTESSFYNGYLFPRLEALTGRTWLAVLAVGLAWTLQHIFIPFIPDVKYLAWHFLQFLGIGMAMPWLFSRLRRLRPLIIAHWVMDISASLFTIQF